MALFNTIAVEGMRRARTQDLKRGVYLTDSYRLLYVAERLEERDEVLIEDCRSPFATLWRKPHVFLRQRPYFVVKEPK